MDHGHWEVDRVRQRCQLPPMTPDFNRRRRLHLERKRLSPLFQMRGRSLRASTISRCRPMHQLAVRTKRVAPLSSLLRRLCWVACPSKPSPGRFWTLPEALQSIITRGSCRQTAAPPLLTRSTSEWFGSLERPVDPRRGVLTAMFCGGVSVDRLCAQMFSHLVEMCERMTPCFVPFGRCQ